MSLALDCRCCMSDYRLIASPAMLRARSHMPQSNGVRLRTARSVDRSSQDGNLGSAQAAA
eukprot:610168-Rhodomonas_salina.2